MATLDMTNLADADVPELIGARMLNEFAYCPRLAYLEWVQGEFADNLDTIEGRFDHRRVDRESRQAVPDPADEDASEEPPFQTRSLMLSAPMEGLIAKMDVVDLNSSEAVPVDYKHGRVPDNANGYWEPEAVQLCAQGLILRENGYHCEGGFLYFVESRRKVAVPFDEELVARTRELLEGMREMGTHGVMPPPLEDSPKCRRCSLVGICLPDETSCLTRDDASKDDRKVRRLLPRKDLALPLYLQEQGAMLGKSGDELTVKRKGELLQSVRLLDVSQVCLFGNVMASAQAIREITSRGIPICHFSYGGWFHAVTQGVAHKNVELRIRQYDVAADPNASLDFARAFIMGKIKNCRTLLRRNLDDDFDGVLPRLNRLVSTVKEADSAETLLGVEGTAARLYFESFPRLIKADMPFTLDGRNRRPPRDPVNALLSFVYALLAKDLTVTLNSVGLDPYLGFYHRPRYGRPSLALDLAEEFRPIVADSVVFSMINNGQITPDDFIRKAGAVALTPSGRKTVLRAYEQRMASEVTHPIFKYRVTYRRILEVQARLLGRTLLGEIGEYPAFTTR